MQAKKMKVNIHLGVRVNSKDNEILSLLAKEMGVGKSDLARRLLREGMLREIAKRKK